LRKKISTSVVGLQYCGIDERIIESLRTQRSLKLVREPSNPHDANAIGFFAQDRRVGFIRRQDAKILSPALASPKPKVEIKITNPNEIKLGIKHFSISVTLELDETYTAKPPKVSDKKTSGIYRLRLTPGDKSYIGQAQDVNIRIAAHWKDLLLGTHTNKHLQAHWNAHGGAGFSAEVVDVAPLELSPYQLQTWLASKEIEWIDKEREANRLDGMRIMTPNAKIDQKALMMQHDQHVKARKAEILKEIELLGKDAAPKLKIEAELELKIKHHEEILWNHTGIIGFFKGKLSQREKEAIQRELSCAKTQLEKVKVECNKYRSKKYELLDEHRRIKTLKQAANSINRALGKHGVRVEPSDLV